MNKSNIKVFILLIIVFAIFFALAYFFQDDRKLSKGLVIINGYNTYEYRYRNWRKASNYGIKWTKFNVYSNQEYVGKFSVNVNNKFYFFDDKIKSHEIEYPFIAFGVDLNIKLVNYKEDSISDNDTVIINNYLKSKKNNYTGQFNVLKKYDVDLNNDKNNDYIYVVSNQLYTDNYIYSVFAYVDSKYIDISYLSKDDNYKSYDLAWVLSVGNDNYNDIILKDNSSEKGNCYLLRYANDKYNFIKR